MSDLSASPPRILLTNDDGYRAEGIRAICRELSEWARVMVVAPDRERSGCGHAITLGSPLRLREVEGPPIEATEWYLLDGTPTDCVNLGVHHLLKTEPPAIVVSGINHGLNIGDDVTYSGTVGAAMEGFLFGLPAVALSQELGPDVDFTRTASHASRIVRQVLDSGEAGLYNVNFPCGEIAGTRATTLSRRVYRDTVVEREDPRGGSYFWIAGTPVWDDADDADMQAVASGIVSVTPLRLDLTDHERVARVETLLDGERGR